MFRRKPITSREEMERRQREGKRERREGYVRGGRDLFANY